MGGGGGGRSRGVLGNKKITGKLIYLKPYPSQRTSREGTDG